MPCSIWAFYFFFRANENARAADMKTEVLSLDRTVKV